ncbi:endoribonuclease ZC3H12A isoform X1 [Dendroctonus ponderosae]|uniref:endoribonuclease ZC3H12A isoform X1 n=1 Tax=Dendroctonus ponderosae TaxID=77166 RepID=UPI002035E1B3|nr:endoribonuclease ZC3H12A isoform X1 [Dendroctonus ponderosae]
MSGNAIGTVTIKSKCVSLLIENLERILVLFAAVLKEKNRPSDNIVVYNVLLSGGEDIARSVSADLITRIQKYIDDICLDGCNISKGSATGEDSSYDSDCEAYEGSQGQLCGSHQDVSRTTSDTLAAEYAEYVQGVQGTAPGYNARVEFALKLGYTEKHVQAALQKLGSSPTQNELLAELIKLGAQKGGSCDSSPTESLVSELGLLDRFELLETGPSTLRPIVIDGSNVAMSHGNKEIFSCRGIKICVDWFKVRGHKDITVFVPKWRKEAPRPDNPVREQDILAELERDRLLVFTPSRLVGGKRMVCYDDRYILKLASQTDGIVVSNDNYRDLCQESTEFRKVVEERVLMYSFVNDHFMPPDDPLGRAGPTLDNFLRRQPRKGDVSGTLPPPPCPYGKKCTYGNKCKYHHPERGPLPHKSVTERLSEHAQRHLQARENKDGSDVRKNPLGRTRSNVPPPKEPQHTIVSKSRSVDNVGVITQSGQYQPITDNFGFQSTPEKDTMSNFSYQTPSSENLHRKLARQLTLNPGADPRLASRRFAPLSPGPVGTSGGYLGSSGWEVHQGVTRIASAPDSYRSAQNTQAAGWSGLHGPQHGQTPSVGHMHRMSSCSDSQLNVWPGQWNPIGSQEDARRKLHYHLAAIFPEEQVIQAMQMYPDETNAQKICAAILAMFSIKS